VAMAPLPLRPESARPSPPRFQIALSLHSNVIQHLWMIYRRFSPDSQYQTGLSKGSTQGAAPAGVVPSGPLGRSFRTANEGPPENEMRMKGE